MESLFYGASMKKLFTVCFFLAVGFQSRATYQLSTNLKNAYTLLMHLHQDSALALISREEMAHPENQLAILFRNYSDFLNAFLSEQKNDFEFLKKRSAERYRQISRMNAEENSPFHLYALAEILLQEAMVKVKFRENVSAATNVRKAYKLIERNSVLFPTFPLNSKLYGFLHVLVGAVPREYQWLVDIAGMEGTIPQGLEELSTLYKSLEGTGYACYREEILFYLSTIMNSFSAHEPFSVQLQNWMLPYTMNSPLIRYSYCNLAMKEGKNDDALRILRIPFDHILSPAFPLLDYKCGLASLRKLDRAADQDFLRFVHEFRGMNYIKSAYQKLAWSALLQGDIRGYHDYMEMCRDSGTAWVDEDKDAMTESVSPQPPNVPLLRARLLFDGGYYQEALAEISGKPIADFPRYRDQLEVTYRLARIMEKTGRKNKAMEYYEQTLKNGSSSRFYFAANSALLLGSMYEEEGNSYRAEEYYKKCLSMEDHEYQNSIDQKARAGLDRLKASAVISGEK
ncbi:MAG: tetratricopeptide repeat protein [Bacteroidia bacterium]|nr:tetratricopeptide repeat protein [Bacteroidia bacterium]